MCRTNRRSQPRERVHLSLKHKRRAESLGRSPKPCSSPGTSPDAVTLEAFAPKIRAPDMICVRHIPSAETVKAKRDEYAFPCLPCGLAYGSNRTVADTRSKRVRVEWNEHALTCFCPHFYIKKERAPIRCTSVLYRFFVSPTCCSLVASCHSASMSLTAFSQSSPSRMRSTAFLPALALW